MTGWARRHRALAREPSGRAGAGPTYRGRHRPATPGPTRGQLGARAEARQVLDRELADHGVEPRQLSGYETRPPGGQRRSGAC